MGSGRLLRNLQKSYQQSHENRPCAASAPPGLDFGIRPLLLKHTEILSNIYQNRPFVALAIPGLDFGIRPPLRNPIKSYQICIRIDNLRPRRLQGWISGSGRSPRNVLKLYLYSFVSLSLSLYIYIYSTYIFLCASINVQTDIVVSKRSVCCTRSVSKHMYPMRVQHLSRCSDPVIVYLMVLA